MGELTAKLVERAFDLSCASLPDAVRYHTKLLILDTCATLLAGSSAPGAREVTEAVNDWGGRAEATVLPSGARVPAFHAALANSAAVHARDYDDFMDHGALHSMAAIFPTIVALAERRRDCSGAMVVEAMTMGLEIAARLANAARDLGIHSGWLPATLFAGIGASIAGGYVAGLSEQATVDAAGITYAQLGGNRQALLDGTLTKRLQPGFAARSAVLAVDLAGRGISGPGGALDGRYGMFPLIVGRPAPSETILEGLGDRFLLQSYDVKAFPCCTASHAAIALVLDIRPALDPSAIEQVVIRLPHLGHQLVGGAFVIRQDPQVDAQFSVAYSVASALVHGTLGIAAFEPQRVVSDTPTLELAKRVKTEEIPGTEHGVAKVKAEVEVATKDGEKITRSQTKVAATSLDRVARKLKECAAYASPPFQDVEGLRNLCMRLDEGPMLADLIDTLTTGVRRRGETTCG